jgi:hypothetical protein
MGGNGEFGMGHGVGLGNAYSNIHHSVYLM